MRIQELNGFRTLQASPAPSGAQTQQDSQLVGRQSSSSTTIIRLEKHLDDYRKGRGNISSEVMEEISAAKAETHDYLAHRDPKALLQYSAYSTMLRYDRKARFANGINKAVDALRLLDKTPPPPITSKVA